jgi:membrane fusion protein (multidrug efflux system)
MAIAVAGCKPEEETGDVEIPPVPVETSVVNAQDFVDRVDVAAVVEPIKEVRVSAEAPGRILRADFEENERVKRGQLLIRVDADQNSAQIDLLENQIATARREFQRTRKLATEGLATPQQLDQAQSMVDTAQLNLKQAKVGLGKTTLRSPIDGYVAQKFVEKGEYAAPGAPVAHIVEYDVVKVMASVPESDIGFVNEGEEVKIFLPSLDRHVLGTVHRRAIIASDATRTYPVEIHVDNADRELLPGMRARVIIPKGRIKDAIVVRRSAILQGFENSEAMVLPGDAEVAKAELRTLELGPSRGDFIVVKSGLKPGDRIIVKGHRAIVGGTKVKVVGTREGVQLDAVAPTPETSEASEASEDPAAGDAVHQGKNGAAESGTEVSKSLAKTR